MPADIIELTQAELDALPFYPASTGGPMEAVPVGTQWKRNDRACDPWLVGEWTGKVGHDVRIKWREVIIVDTPRKNLEITLLTKEEFDGLDTYSSTIPSPEMMNGKQWKREKDAGPWLLGEHIEVADRKRIDISWKEIRLVSAQERIRAIREEKLGEFSQAFDVERKAMQEMIRELQAKNISIAREGNLKDREIKELREWKQSMTDKALASMQAPLLSRGDIKDLEQRIEALEKAQIDKATDSEGKSKTLLCKLFNAVTNGTRREDVKLTQEIMNTMEECREFFGV
jgi:hypothetical protein